jgi:hypothetical protein
MLRTEQINYDQRSPSVGVVQRYHQQNPIQLDHDLPIRRQEVEPSSTPATLINVSQPDILSFGNNLRCRFRAWKEHTSIIVVGKAVLSSCSTPA